MEIIKELFGEGESLHPLQMALRTVVVFLVGIFLIRLSGRRTFSMNISLDNVITIMMGGILTRGVDGKTPFLGVLACAATLAILYRLINWGCLYIDWIGKLIKGKEKVIYKEGKFNTKEMKRFMMTEEDVIERVRSTGHFNTLEKVEQIYVERDGEISFIKKEKQ
jgi:uncharacterized membrane protein YcaP (DUF421 family)